MKKKFFKWQFSVIILLLIFSFIIYTYQRNNTQNTHGINQSNQTAQSKTSSRYKLVKQELSIPDQFKNGTFAQSRTLFIPENAKISLYSAGLTSPRFMAFDDDGNLYVTEINSGQVVLIKDSENDFVGDQQIVVDKGLRKPHGIDYFEDDLYVGEEHQIIVYRSIKSNGTYATKEILIPNLPTDGGHSSRTVIVGPDRKLYVSIGSSCNVCVESDERRAAIVQYNLDGSGEKIFAKGLRNSVGITFLNDKLWSVDNGRDRIGDDLPPEEVNIITEGKHYGWPYCYGDRFPNPEYQNQLEFCQVETTSPTYEMQAHSAPLGFDFSPEKIMTIAFHGSWNRTEPTGYKVVTIDTNAENPQVEDYITGWLDGNTVWGRPVDVQYRTAHEIFITDDYAGAIYRLTIPETIN